MPRSSCWRKALLLLGLNIVLGAAGATAVSVGSGGPRLPLPKRLADFSTRKLHLRGLQLVDGDDGHKKGLQPGQHGHQRRSMQAAATEAITIVMAGSQHSFTAYQLSVSNKRDYADAHGYNWAPEVLTCQVPSSPKPEGQQAAEGGATRKLDVRAEELRQQQEHDAFVAACLWQRIELVKGMLESSRDGEWLWFIDFDTILTNPETRLEDVISYARDYGEHPGPRKRKGQRDDDAEDAGDRRKLVSSKAAPAEGGKQDGSIDFIVSQRCGITNMGSFLMRASAWSRAFIGEVLELRRAPKGTVPWMCAVCPDQEAVDHAMRFPQHAAHVALVPAKLINALPQESTGNRCTESGDSWEPGDFIVHFAGHRAKGLLDKYWAIANKTSAAREVRGRLAQAAQPAPSTAGKQAQEAGSASASNKVSGNVGAGTPAAAVSKESGVGQQNKQLKMAPPSPAGASGAGAAQGQGQQAKAASTGGGDRQGAGSQSGKAGPGAAPAAPQQQQQGQKAQGQQQQPSSPKNVTQGLDARQKEEEARGLHLVRAKDVQAADRSWDALTDKSMQRIFAPILGAGAVALSAVLLIWYWSRPQLGSSSGGREGRRDGLVDLQAWPTRASAVGVGSSALRSARGNGGGSASGSRGTL